MSRASRRGILAGPKAVGPGASTTWDAGNKSPSVTLSGGALTAQATLTANWTGVTGTASRSVKSYFEVLVNAIPGGIYPGIGVALASHLNSNYSGGDAVSVGFFNDGTVYYNGAPSSTGLTFVPFDIVGVLFDPAAGTSFNVNGGGFTAPYGFLGTPAFPIASFNSNGIVVTLNCGQSSFIGGLPSGAVPWG